MTRAGRLPAALDPWGQSVATARRGPNPEVVGLAVAARVADSQPGGHPRCSRAKLRAGWSPGDPARMAVRIIDSVDVEPAPLGIVLDP